MGFGLPWLKEQAHRFIKTHKDHPVHYDINETNILHWYLDYNDLLLEERLKHPVGKYDTKSAAHKGKVEAILPNEVASGTMWDVMFTPFASKAMCDVSTHGIAREEAAWNAIIDLMQGNLKYCQSRGEGPSAHSEVFTLQVNANVMIVWLAAVVRLNQTTWGEVMFILSVGNPRAENTLVKQGIKNFGALRVPACPYLGSVGPRPKTPAGTVQPRTWPYTGNDATVSEREHTLRGEVLANQHMLHAFSTYTLPVTEILSTAELMFKMSQQEIRVVGTKGNTLLIGRSGTGKTTCAILKLFATNASFRDTAGASLFDPRSAHLRSASAERAELLERKAAAAARTGAGAVGHGDHHLHGHQNPLSLPSSHDEAADDGKGFKQPSASENASLETDAEPAEPAEPAAAPEYVGVHTLFITVSPILCSEIRSYYRKLAKQHDPDAARCAGLFGHVAKNTAAAAAAAAASAAASTSSSCSSSSSAPPASSSSHRNEPEGEHEDGDHVVLDDDDDDDERGGVGPRTALDDVDNEEAVLFADLPPTLLNLCDKDFPLFLTLRRFLLMLDGTLHVPFFVRDETGEVQGFSDSRTWNPSGRVQVKIKKRALVFGAEAEAAATADAAAAAAAGSSSSSSSAKAGAGKEGGQVKDGNGGDHANDDGDDDDDDDDWDDLGDILPEQSPEEAEEFLRRQQQKRDSKRRYVESVVTATEVDYDLFASLIYPQIGFKSIHPSVAWTEIISVIKGGPRSRGRSLTEHEYYQCYSHATVSRSEIWVIYRRYDNFIRRHNFYDVEDVVQHVYSRIMYEGYRGAPVHFAYVDEVQDMTQSTLALLMAVCQNTNGFFFTGDTCQTIARGIGFRFSDLVHTFGTLKNPIVGVSTPTIQQLTVNFRSHRNILNIGHSVVALLENFFPASIDKLAKDRGTKVGPKPGILAMSAEELFRVLMSVGGIAGASHIEFGARQAIIVRDEAAKRRLPSFLSHALVLTVIEAKGLEFDDVILYNFFTDSPNPASWPAVPPAQVDIGIPQRNLAEVDVDEEQAAVEDAIYEMYFNDMFEDGGSGGVFNFLFPQSHEDVRIANILADIDERHPMRSRNGNYKVKMNLVTAAQPFRWNSATRDAQGNVESSTRILPEDEQSYGPDYARVSAAVTNAAYLKWNRLDPSADAILCSELKHLYTAITRPKRKLFIFDENSNVAAPMYRYWIANKLVDVYGADDERLSRVVEKTSRAEWRKQGVNMYRRRFYAAAARCFANSGDEDYQARAAAFAEAAAASRIASQIDELEGDLRVSLAVRPNLTAAQKRAILENPRVLRGYWTPELVSLSAEKTRLASSAAEAFFAAGLVKQGAAYCGVAGDHLRAGTMFAQLGMHFEAAQAFAEDGTRPALTAECAVMAGAMDLACEQISRLGTPLAFEHVFRRGRGRVDAATWVTLVKRHFTQWFLAYEQALARVAATVVGAPTAKSVAAAFAANATACAAARGALEAPHPFHLSESSSERGVPAWDLVLEMLPAMVSGLSSDLKGGRVPARADPLFLEAVSAALLNDLGVPFLALRFLRDNSGPKNPLASSSHAASAPAAESTLAALARPAIAALAHSCYIRRNTSAMVLCVGAWKAVRDIAAEYSIFYGQCEVASEILRLAAEPSEAMEILSAFSGSSSHVFSLATSMLPTGSDAGAPPARVQVACVDLVCVAWRSVAKLAAQAAKLVANAAAATASNAASSGTGSMSVVVKRKVSGASPAGEGDGTGAGATGGGEDEEGDFDEEVSPDDMLGLAESLAPRCENRDAVAAAVRYARAVLAHATQVIAALAPGAGAAPAAAAAAASAGAVAPGPSSRMISAAEGVVAVPAAHLALISVAIGIDAARTLTGPAVPAATAVAAAEYVATLTDALSAAVLEEGASASGTLAGMRRYFGGASPPERLSRMRGFVCCDRTGSRRVLLAATLMYGNVAQANFGDRLALVDSAAFDYASLSLLLDEAVRALSAAQHAATARIAQEFYPEGMTHTDVAFDVVGSPAWAQHVGLARLRLFGAWSKVASAAARFRGVVLAASRAAFAEKEAQRASRIMGHVSSAAKTAALALNHAYPKQCPLLKSYSEAKGQAITLRSSMESRGASLLAAAKGDFASAFVGVGEEFPGHGLVLEAHRCYTLARKAVTVDEFLRRTEPRDLAEVIAGPLLDLAAHREAGDWLAMALCVDSLVCGSSVRSFLGENLAGLLRESALYLTLLSAHLRGTEVTVPAGIHAAYVPAALAHLGARTPLSAAARVVGLFRPARADIVACSRSIAAHLLSLYTVSPEGGWVRFACAEALVMLSLSGIPWGAVLERLPFELPEDSIVPEMSRVLLGIARTETDDDAILTEKALRSRSLALISLHGAPVILTFPKPKTVKALMRADGAPSRRGKAQGEGQRQGLGQGQVQGQGQGRGVHAHAQKSSVSTTKAAPKTEIVVPVNDMNFPAPAAARKAEAPTPAAAPAPAPAGVWGARAAASAPAWGSKGTGASIVSGSASASSGPTTAAGATTAPSTAASAAASAAASNVHPSSSAHHQHPASGALSGAQSDSESDASWDKASVVSSSSSSMMSWDKMSSAAGSRASESGSVIHVRRGGDGGAGDEDDSESLASSSLVDVGAIRDAEEVLEESAALAIQTHWRKSVRRAQARAAYRAEVLERASRAASAVLISQVVYRWFFSDDAPQASAAARPVTQLLSSLPSGTGSDESSARLAALCTGPFAKMATRTRLDLAAFAASRTAAAASGSAAANAAAVAAAAAAAGAGSGAGDSAPGGAAAPASSSSSSLSSAPAAPAPAPGAAGKKVNLASLATLAEVDSLLSDNTRIFDALVAAHPGRPSAELSSLLRDARGHFAVISKGISRLWKAAKEAEGVPLRDLGSSVAERDKRRKALKAKMRQSALLRRTLTQGRRK